MNKPIETFLGKHKQLQLHANIQSARSNFSSCWITTITTGCIFLQIYFMGKLMNQSINLPDSIASLNDKLSMHYKLYSINTTNKFKRLQFSVLLAFGMTINKAQGQSPQVCGLNLENLCFSHGQLYVAFKRVGKPSDLFVYTLERKIKILCIQKHFNKQN